MITYEDPGYAALAIENKKEVSRLGFNPTETIKIEEKRVA